MFSRNEDRVPLTGAGCFLRAVDRETRQYSGASHLSQLVLNLGDRPDPDRVRKFFRVLFRSVPHLSAPIRRPYGIGYPSYCIPRDEPSRGNIIQVHSGDDVSEPGFLAAPIRHRLSAKFNIKQGQLLAVDLVLVDNQVQFALTWAHMLFDGYGIEVFVDRLAQAWERWNRTGRFPEGLFVSDVTSPLPDLVEDRSWGERLTITRAWSDRVTSLTDEGPTSLSGPLTSEQQDLEVSVNAFDKNETETVLDRATEFGGHMRPMMFYLAVSMRAHYAVMRARGDSVSTLLVPVAVNMREGIPDPIFDTQVSFLWFTASPEVLASLPELIDHLKQQRLDFIRDNFHERTAVALETVKYTPTRFYRRFIRGPFDGELASFFFSYTGDFLPDVDTLFGADVDLGVHAPGVPPSPGSSLIFSLHRERLTMTHVHQRNLLTESEHDLFFDRVRSDLLDRDSGVLETGR